MTSPETISMKTMKMFLRTQPPPPVFASRPLIDSSPIGLLGEIPSVTHERGELQPKELFEFSNLHKHKSVEYVWACMYG